MKILRTTVILYFESYFSLTSCGTLGVTIKNLFEFANFCWVREKWQVYCEFLYVPRVCGGACNLAFTCESSLPASLMNSCRDRVDSYHLFSLSPSSSRVVHAWATILFFAGKTRVNWNFDNSMHRLGENCDLLKFMHIIMKMLLNTILLSLAHGFQSKYYEIYRDSRAQASHVNLVKALGSSRGKIFHKLKWVYYEWSR